MLKIFLPIFILTALATNALAQAKKSYCLNSKTTFYSAANTKSKKLKDLPRYSPVTLTGEKKKTLVQVKDVAGRTGWIRSTKLKSKLNCIAISKNKTTLRSGPGTSYQLLGESFRGEAYLDLGGEDGWTKVQNEKGQTFWVQIDATWKPSTTMRMSFENER